MRLIQRILCQGHIQGYIAEDDAGGHIPMTYNVIVSGIQDGSLSIENAKVSSSRYGIKTLRGVKCKLQELPPVHISADDPLIYRLTHVVCIGCQNNGKPVCDTCMQHDDYRFYKGTTYITRA